MTDKKNRLLELQKSIGAIKRDSDNPYFKSKYFDINALLREIKPILNEHGFVLTQALSVMEGKNGLSTAIVDEDENVVIQSQVLLPEGLDAQKMGSAISYLRRYSLQSLLAIEAIDDDANEASGKTNKTQDASVPF